MFSLKIVSVFLILLGGSACSSIGTMHTARPIAKHTTEISIFIGSIVDANTPESDLGTSEDGTEEYRSFDETLFPQNGELEPIVPGITLQLRHGYTSKFDAGLKLYPMGVDADFNFLLFEGNHLAISIDPRLQFFLWGGNSGREENAGSEDVHFTSKIGIVWLPLLFDVYHRERVTMTIGAKGGLLIGLKNVDQSDGSKQIEDVGISWLAGLSLGWKIKQSKKWSFLPEVAGMYDFKNRGIHVALSIGWARKF